MEIYEMHDRAAIVALADKWGFANHSYVEKFFMCLEAHHHISQRTNCIVRGGLCMPFYQNFEVRRMSIDVDIMSPCSMEEVGRAIDGIANDRFKPVKHNPVKPYPIENLVSYKIWYASHFGEDTYVKVDAFCNASIDITHQHMPQGQRIMGVDVQHEMDILSRGALVADKCTALALDTIGLRRVGSEVVKQVYDIATLLRSSSQNDIATAYKSYMILTEFKVGCFRHDPPHTASDVILDMIKSLYGFLVLDSSITITSDHTNHYLDFCSTYVSKQHKYKKLDHIADVLLVYIFGLLLKRYHARVSYAHDPNTTEINDISFMYEVVKELDALQNSMHDNPEEEQKMRSRYIQDIPDNLEYKKSLRGARLDLVFLINVITSILTA